MYNVAKWIKQLTSLLGKKHSPCSVSSFQVPHLKKPALTISLLPEDVGKPTFKLEKAAVQDGTCSWEKPIYVTVKLIRQAKTGKLNEKIYHFIVSSVRNSHFPSFSFPRFSRSARAC